jgi:hypothetical protein
MSGTLSSPGLDAAAGSSPLNSPPDLLIVAAMRRRVLPWLGLAGVMVVVLAAPPPAVAAAPDDAEALIAKGNELRRRGDAKGALPLFQKAFELSPTPRTEGQLGLAEMAAGDPIAAETHLGAALASSSHQWISANRSGLEQTLARARAQIGDVTIAGSPAGAKVSVNGRLVGQLPLASPIRLAPGLVEIVVSAAGFQAATRTLPLGPGEHARQLINLAPWPSQEAPLSHAGSPAAGAATSTAAASAPSTATAPSAEPSSTSGAGAPPAVAPPVSAPAVDLSAARTPAALSTSPMRIAAWVTAGLAVAGLGAGIGLNLAALSKNSEFTASCGLDHGNPVPKATSSLTIQDCTDLRNTWSTEKTWSLVGYAGAAALAVTSGVLFWSSRSSDSHDSHAKLDCAPAVAGIVCGGRF